MREGIEVKRKVLNSRCILIIKLQNKMGNKKTVQYFTVAQKSFQQYLFKKSVNTYSQYCSLGSCPGLKTSLPFKQVRLLIVTQLIFINMSPVTVLTLQPVTKKR